MSETIIKIDHVSKEYRLGAIGGGTLRGDLQSWWARVRGKDDPNLQIGKTAYTGNEKFLALDDISFEVKKGEAVGIIGHNGAGKSTLLKLLSRVTAPTKGTIGYNGRIASMLEVGTGFHPELTGRENVYMNGAILGMTKAEISRKFDQIVEFAEMEKFIDTPVKRYSSGMYVKLAFAVAAHLDSEILVMDEVLAVGDMKFQQKCLGKMGDAANNEGRTVLYVSHNMNTIRQLCSRCVVLDHGKVAFDGGVEEGIGVYMDAGTDQGAYREYTKAEHKNEKSTDRFVIKSLFVLNKQRATFTCGETAKIKIIYSAKDFFQNMNFRFEIYHFDNQMIGTMLSAKGINIEPGENRNAFISMDTAHMMAGRYRADIVAYIQNDFGNELLIDGVYPGFDFELVEDNNGNTSIIWNEKAWGHIRLHDIELID